ncbi:MAG: hypothetical protein JWM74_538 [Myxococcaceae bacterium]|nr:hypothetical protein [Myxococcaceae bacterium]
MFPNPRALRRRVGFGVVTAMSASVALSCSQASSHPPTSGDCFGDLCAPPIARYVTPDRSAEAADAAGGNADDGAGTGVGGALIDTNVTLSPDAFSGGALIDTNVTLSPDAFF